MSVNTTTASLKNMLLFADLEESKLEDFQQIFQFVSFAPGGCLLTQGHAANGNATSFPYVLKDGQRLFYCLRDLPDLG